MFSNDNLFFSVFCMIC